MPAQLGSRRWPPYSALLACGRIGFMPGGTRLVDHLGRTVPRLLSDASEDGGRSFRTLDNASGANFSQVNRMLAGEKVMTLDEYASLCEVLNLDPVHVLRDAEPVAAACGRGAGSRSPEVVVPPVWGLAVSDHSGWEAERRESESLPAVEPEDESQHPPDDLDCTPTTS